jgi:hypothetical protein
MNDLWSKRFGRGHNDIVDIGVTSAYHPGILWCWWFWLGKVRLVASGEWREGKDEHDPCDR